MHVFAQGRIEALEHVYEGLARAVPAFIGMLQGQDFGKSGVRP